MTSTGLSEIKPVDDQGQDAITSNWRSYQQVKRGKVLQQTVFHLEI